MANAALPSSSSSSSSKQLSAVLSCQRILTSWSPRYGLKGLRAPKVPFTGWYFPGGNPSWKVSHPSLPQLLAAVACHPVHCRHSIGFISAMLFAAQFPRWLFWYSFGAIRSSLVRGTSGFMVEPCQNKQAVWLHLSLPLLWGRMHYIQFVSNRYFSNLFLQHLGGGDSHLVSCPSLSLCPQLESDRNVKFPAAN